MRILSLLASSCLATTLLFAGSAAGQSIESPVAICDLLKNPSSFDRQEISVRGSISLEFEDFSMDSSDCKVWPPVWLMFGGDVATPTMSTWNDTVRNLGVDVKIKNIPRRLTKDEAFEKFYALITARRGRNAAYKVTATLTGTFFAVPQNARFPSGYGHLHCCHLLVISEVSNVSSVPPGVETLKGSVASSDGMSISGVRVINETGTCCQVLGHETVTDEKGRFEFRNPSQVLYFQEPNYQPQAVALDGSLTNIHVVLEDSRKTDWNIGECKIPTDSGRFVGFSYQFWTPQEAGLSKRERRGTPYYAVWRPGSNAGYSVRIFTKSENEGFENASYWIARSTTWSQRWIKNGTGGVVGVDTTGRAEDDGVFWRVVRFENQDGAAFAVGSKGDAEYLAEIVASACTSRP